MSRILDKFRVPKANNVRNKWLREVIGNKSDAAAVGAVTETDTLVAYMKQAVTAIINLDLADDVLGAIDTAAATGAVTDVDLMMAYIKQLVTEGIARDTAIDTIDTIVDAILADTGTDGVVIAADGITNAKIADDTFSEEHFDTDSSMKMILGDVVQLATATLPQTAASTLFTITGGRVLVTSIVGEVTTVIETLANNTKLTANPTTGTSVDMCAVLDISADEVGCLYGITGDPADALVGTNAGLTVGMKNGLVVNEGTIDLDCAASATGSIKWTLHYIPIDVGATVS